MTMDELVAMIVARCREPEFQSYAAPDVIDWPVVVHEQTERAVWDLAGDQLQYMVPAIISDVADIRDADSTSGCPLGLTVGEIIRRRLYDIAHDRVLEQMEAEG